MPSHDQIARTFRENDSKGSIKIFQKMTLNNHCKNLVDNLLECLQFRRHRLCRVLKLVLRVVYRIVIGAPSSLFALYDARFPRYVISVLDPRFQVEAGIVDRL